MSIACTASDGGSGLADPADASFSLTTSVPAGSEDANASTGSREVCDQAGNCTTAGPIIGNKIDKKAPAISIVRPRRTHLPAARSRHGELLVRGRRLRCGLLRRLGRRTGPSIDTTSVGTRDFTVSATDGVGNQASATTTYTIAYDVFLRYKPAKPTRQIKVRLQDALGANVSSSMIVLTALSIDGSQSAGGTFSYRKKSKDYAYSIRTRDLSRGAHTLQFRAGSDPTIHSVPFTVK